MAQNPAVQARAQAELDAVVGPTRLPEHADRDALSYVTAVMLEVMRWRPVVPTGPCPLVPGRFHVGSPTRVQRSRTRRSPTRHSAGSTSPPAR
jgi:cytochrome P450